MNLLAERRLWTLAIVSLIGISSGELTQTAFASPQEESSGNQEDDQNEAQARGDEALAQARDHAAAGRWRQAADAFRTAAWSPTARTGFRSEDLPVEIRSSGRQSTGSQPYDRSN